MPTSTLSIPADTEQVRVARLVACSAARRAGVNEDDIEDVRLAVGEAVGLAVLRHLNAEIGAPVVIDFIDEIDSFEVCVKDEAAGDGPDAGFAKAVISGLVPDAEFADRTIAMRWVL